MRDSTQYILALVRSFPCLRSKLQGWNPEEFAADEFYGRMSGWSSGELLCGLFILNVWNPSYARRKGWTFDLFVFMNTADCSNTAAFQDWVLNPHFP